MSYKLYKLAVWTRTQHANGRTLLVGRCLLGWASILTALTFLLDVSETCIYQDWIKIQLLLISASFYDLYKRQQHKSHFSYQFPFYLSHVFMEMLLER